MGMSVLNSFTKLYDMVLCARLQNWFVAYREQVGAQKERGCIDHNVTLRLLTNFAKKKKITMFVTL